MQALQHNAGDMERASASIGGGGGQRRLACGCVARNIGQQCQQRQGTVTTQACNMHTVRTMTMGGRKQWRRRATEVRLRARRSEHRSTILAMTGSGHRSTHACCIFNEDTGRASPITTRSTKGRHKRSLNPITHSPAWYPRQAHCASTALKRGAGSKQEVCIKRCSNNNWSRTRCPLNSGSSRARSLRISAVPH